MSEKREEKALETVVFTFSKDRILRELFADSSYVAKSLVGQVELKPGWSAPLVFTEDDTPFLDRWLSDVRDEMTRSLSGYLSGEYPVDGADVVFAVCLSPHRPMVVDESICHQLERAIVHYILAQWFAPKLLDESTRRMLQYQAALSAVKSDIRLARNRRPHRPTHYF